MAEKSKKPEKNIFYNGMFDGLLNTGPENVIYASFQKLLSLLTRKESYRLSLFMNRLTSSPEQKTYVEIAKKIHNEFLKYQNELIEAKKESLKKVKASEKQIKAMIADYTKSIDYPPELRQKMVSNANDEAEFKESFVKHIIKWDDVTEYEIPDDATVDEMEKIRSWNLNGSDIKNLSNYIEFK